ncbi:poly-gamma-glutamate hydrolase family protein [Phyllobacterium sp. 0TCS1.6C]|uniref:poly-gamma-glutamate hydrolase family protein n=1 Tax=unclassified Phyllobacterium TaxID=2638441 RepID=UPI0022651AC5|nr:MULTISPECIES: poly-gamma-glutamate hydrolase family protein [unclassified Phyllobacterium]MCX8281524.1 poly-gamma-glutamate hydrolase family protein [Phyllobacterium sp. 0TCS1.6C]MCX8292880.1 poly-gamma-glutamate hydrolase family protein [Phyllobacterium sp. 0TCS1.6A]
MAHQDKYTSYEELCQHEVEDIHYSVTARPISGSRIAIVAPHGGGIEFLTAELVRSIAGEDHNYYAFKGLKKTANQDLHITSHRFNEPRALGMIGLCEKVLTVHGLKHDTLSLQVGGRDTVLRERIHAALGAAGFDSKVVTEGAYGGMEPQNICNLGKTSSGVQLEINAGLRQVLRDDGAAYDRFVQAVRSTL